MATKQEGQRRLQARYGIAPPEFSNAIGQTLNTIQEEPKVRRFTIRTALLAALFIVLMASIALAIGNSLGILNMLGLQQTEDETITSQIQTEFTQEGGDLEHVTIRVRDAVSDGRMLFISLEAKARNADHMLVQSSDLFDWNNEEAIEFMERYAKEENDMPDIEALRSAKTVHALNSYVDTRVLSGASVVGTPPMTGVHWKYEDHNTLLSFVTLDLQRLRDVKDVISLVFFMGTVGEDIENDAPYPENAAPIYNHIKSLENTTLHATIRLGNMPLEHYEMEPEVYMDEHLEIKQLTLTVSPLATYINISSRHPQPTEERNYWYAPHDETGNRYQTMLFTGTNLEQPNADGSWDFVPLSMIYEKRESDEAPTAVLFRALPYNDTLDNQTLPPDIVIPMVPVP